MKRQGVLMVIIILVMAATGWCGDKTKILTSADTPVAIADGYFDSATGHRYYKTGTGTYSEYSQKGRFLKTVPSDQPLLVTGKNIHPITQEVYILYQRTAGGKNDYLALPGCEKHPEGWKAENALVSLD